MSLRILLPCALLGAAAACSRGYRGDTASPDGGSVATVGDAGVDAAPSPEREGGRGDSTYIVALGGLIDDSTFSSEVFVGRIEDDGAIASWTSTTFPKPIALAGLVALDGRLHVLGGMTSMYPWNATSVGELSGDAVKSWTDGAPITPYATQDIHRHATVSHRGRIYVLGGASPAVSSVVFTEPSPTSGAITAWQATTSLPAPRDRFVSVVIGDHLYVLTAGDSLVSEIAGDGNVGPWIPTTPFPLSTVAAGGAASDTHVYVSGGYAAGAYDYVKYAAAQADGLLGSWVDGPKLALGRAELKLVYARGHLYAIGGTADGVRTPSVEVADVRTDGSLSAWRSTTPLPKGVSYPAVTTFEAP